MPIYNLNSTGVSSSTPGAPTAATIGTTSASIGTAAGKGYTVLNTGNTTIYISVAATPTTALYNVRIPAGGYYEDPYYSVGAINAISSAAGGTANVTIYA